MTTLGILLLLSGCLTAVGAAEVTVQISNSQVTPGDDVTVQCTLLDFHIGQYINWYKRQENDWVVVGTANEILGDFIETGRYSVESRMEGDNAHFTLHVRGVTYADSGDIGCAMGSSADKIFASLTVTSAPSEIKLFSMDSVENKVAGHEYLNGERVQFKAGDSLYFQCKTANSNPPVDFIMTLGEQILTSHFEKTSKKFLRGGTLGLQEIYYETVATTVQAVNFTKEASDQEFTCSASVHNYQPIKISITPYVMHAPKVECEKKEVLAQLHAKNTELSCMVTSSEALTDVMWMYSHHDGSRTILRGTESESHYYSTIAKEKEGVASAKLLIDMVALSSFRDYTVVANNSIGSSHDSVSLRQDSAKESTQGAGSLRAGATLLMVAAICAYLRL